MMLFATFVIERDPPQWADLPAGVESWLQDAGGFAAAGLAIWILAYLLRRPGASTSGERRPGLARLFVVLAVVSLMAYLAAGAVQLLAAQGQGPDAAPAATPAGAPQGSPWISRLLTIGGGAALLAVGLPFLFDLARLRWRRIWALALVSLKEAVRRKVLWVVFSALLLVFLFANWFIPYKPEDQVRNYVHIISLATTVLFLITASLLAAISIPADIKSQTIYTIVTKPVERFEIVLGRFIGYAVLMTVALVLATGVSLLYLLREIDPDARYESLRARVPVFGELAIPGAVSVGYEWEYRKFIAGGPSSPHRAIWSYRDLPAQLASRQDPVPCEFSFEIFRTTKGEENKGVFCTFTFQTWHWDPSLAGKYAKEREEELNKPNADPKAIDDQLAQKYGFYELRSKEVVDYHTLGLEVPAGVFKNALDGSDQRPIDINSTRGERIPELQVVMKCESATQYVGVARRDLYLLDYERSFAENFFKGAAGLWLRLCLVIGLAIACSTYLSGVIAWLATMFLYIAGFFEEFIRNLAKGTSIGGGPMESLVRLVNKNNLVTPLDPGAGSRFALGSDEVFRWGLRRFLDIIPDVEQYDFTHYVAEGFNIALGQQLLLSLVLLIGYLLPWAILSYYLIKSREVAS